MEARWELQQEKTRAGTGQVLSQEPEGGQRCGGDPAPGGLCLLRIPSPPASWAAPARAEGREGDAPLGVY